MALVFFILYLVFICLFLYRTHKLSKVIDRVADFVYRNNIAMIHKDVGLSALFKLRYLAETPDCFSMIINPFSNINKFVMGKIREDCKQIREFNRTHKLGRLEFVFHEEEKKIVKGKK